MQPEPKKPEVVYRKTPDPRSGASSSFERGPGYAPATVPLIVGFLLLLGLILVLGMKSASQMTGVGSTARNLTIQYSTQVNRLIDARLKVIKLNTEARVRDGLASKGQFKPPMDVGVSNAREELLAAQKLLVEPAHLKEGTWNRFQTHLQAFIDVTEDQRNFSLHGFDHYLNLDSDFNEVTTQAVQNYHDVDQEIEDVQRQANQTIIKWSIIAVLVGALVAAGTIWQVQRHFSDMRRSVLETRRERTFTTQLLEGMVSAVAAIDNEDRIRSANAAFFRVFPNGSIGASVLEKLGPDDAMKMLETVTSIRVNKATYHGRSVAKVDDEEKAFDVYSSPLAINGEPGQIVTLVDATEVAESERTLRRSESLAAVGQATTQVAHEIRNPLGSIRLGVSMLRDSVNDPEALNTIELVERGIKHLNKLVVDVTQYSRQKELERSTVDLHDSLERSIDLVTDKIQEKKATVEKHFAGRSIVGQWDPYQLRQVFVNVIANAVDASQENSAVLISTELLTPETNGDGQPARSYARITITDNGKGMDRATRDRIFEPFFSTKKRGTGLGLAIVKQIVELHGGRISVASEPGKGSKFKIDLPV
ncbi:MAG TPA: ATP-binding protein [Pyrinomonadaceae bacterium]|nr:ATP-binding protein [Pyrinomonadaceae bacterium]